MKTPLDCIMERENNPKMIGEYVSLKTRMSAGDAHYAGELVEGAHIVTACRPGSGTWQSGCDSGCTWSPGGVQPDDYKAPDSRIWKRNDGDGWLLRSERNRSRRYGTDRNGDIGDPSGHY